MTGKALNGQGPAPATLADRYKVTSAEGFDLDRFASNDLPDDAPVKEAAAAHLASCVARISSLQETLYSSATWALLVLFQAMDGGGKDSTIKHVFSGVNPQGVVVTSFKAPDSTERAHDFLWRVHRAMPKRGMIAVFNRSHYEDVLVTRVHKSFIEGSGIPDSLRGTEGFWRNRIADIAAFEAYLSRQGIKIIKIFLNVGYEEQRARLLARLDDPSKVWKFDPGDVKERALWPDYRKAYGDAIAGTATPEAPWLIVPGDRKWFARVVVAEAVAAALESLHLQPASRPASENDQLAEARQVLQHG